MNKEVYRIVLTKQQNKLLFVYLNGSKPVEFHVFSDKKEQLGSIYLGRVQQVVSNINASFIDFGENARGFLPRSDLKQGDLIPVQLVKERTKTKDAVLSEELSLAGVYSVIHTKDTKLSVSSKLSVQEKKQLVKSLRETGEGIPYGVIIRTNAMHADIEELKKEIRQLSERLSAILKYAGTRTPSSALYRAPAEWMRAVTDVRLDALTEIVTDEKEIYKNLREHLTDTYGAVYFSSVNLRFYEDSLLPMKKLYAIESRLKEALQKKVWLKSGGFLVIEPTEALVAIDVNTGKTVKKGSREETFLLVNIEAAAEIARQLRLRNLSGIILIDFINMEAPASQKKLLAFLAEELKKDPIKAQLHDMTTLGLVEVTRMKVRQPLYEQLKDEQKEG
ncbi:MAG: ribonuclease E/G [Lachnospiraceae bacterium]